MPMNVIWEKLDRLCYPAMKTVWSYVVHSFWHNAGLWRTDRRSDRNVVVNS